MIKTFSLGADSHVEIDIKKNDDGKMILMVSVDENTSDKQELSEVFGTSLTIPFLEKTIELGLMNKDYTWKSFVTQQMIALWIEICGEKIGRRIKWTEAERFWNLGCLRKARSKSVNEVGLVKGGDLIEACFISVS